MQGRKLEIKKKMSQQGKDVEKQDKRRCKMIKIRPKKVKFWEFFLWDHLNFTTAFSESCNKSCVV